MLMLSSSGTLPTEADDGEREERLHEHLDRAHRANLEAREAIEAIYKELRFPLAFSTRIKEVDDAGPVSNQRR